MTNSSPTVVLVALKFAPEAQRDALRNGIARLELALGQEVFVGNPLQMTQVALDDPARHPFAVVSTGMDVRVIGMGILHVGAATDAGWPDAQGAVLLRGFLVDHRQQGQGYGSAATMAAVELARELTSALQLPAKGVVLGVSVDNRVAHDAYLRAGFAVKGRFLGGRSGPQHIMYSPFS
ncbi:GNAT family N-acetyltransferase [Arthrobacter glacialis]|uniref:GNAT family N-acetyltransferase n=1 Tax=Arthrobacter glacialis TaxID=1664 RepID=A0A2S3ZVD2_ARTGL|nr:GNAT family N-acetyltransferase [Arthrobacter glacialis]POH58246.1 GNAT family N-acetyltransferase [Arthrobacter glacialis]POH72817.1 GNAT family N-acetyltransferase [Arthrobacter glacialis]